MTESLELKIKQVYKDCKALVAKHEFAPLLDNSDHTEKEVWDEYARQINYTNVFKAKERDLYYILTLLNEAKAGVSDKTPSGIQIKIKLDSYINMIKLLLEAYKQINIGQRWILAYYEKGGGLM